MAELLERAYSGSAWYARVLSEEVAKEVLSELKNLIDNGSSPFSLLEALARLPFTKPEDLASNSDLFLAATHDEVAGIVSVPTSGTSGSSKRIYSTAPDLEETIAFFEYGMRVMVNPDHDRVALAMSPARPGNVGDLLGRALARWGIPFIAQGFVPQDQAEEEDWLNRLIQWRPTCLVGVPAQMLALSRHRLAPRLASSLKTMLLSGDVADGRLVAELEKNLPGCRVYRHYGLTEAGLGGAVECRLRQWPHLRDDLLVEIIEPDTGLNLPPGRFGEIVVTPLTRLGSPLLRYRTGDEGLLIAEECQCGTIFPRLRTFGRLSDRLTLPTGRVLRVNDLEEPLMSLPFIRDYSLCQHQKRGGGLSLVINVVSEAPERAAHLAAMAVLNWLGPDGRGLSLGVKRGGKESITDKRQGGKRRLRQSDGPLSDGDMEMLIVKG